MTSPRSNPTGHAAQAHGVPTRTLLESRRRTESEENHCQEILPGYAEVMAMKNAKQRAEIGKIGKAPNSPVPDSQNGMITVDVAGTSPFHNTAIILIGYQEDYFGKDGKLRTVIEASSEVVLNNTIKLIEAVKDHVALIVETPIVFTRDYSELVEPSGILKVIKDVQAFQAGTAGAETIPELKAYGQRILQVPGKRGLNAFTGTCLERLLKAKNITDVVLAGAVTSVCIDSTGRAAHERGFRVHVLSDCTCGRTESEQDFFCNSIFPLYSEVSTTDMLIQAIDEATDASQHWRGKEGAEVQVVSVDEPASGDAAEEKTARGEEVVDKALWTTFDGVCNTSLILEWMRQHPEDAVKLRERQDEIALQIHHNLVDYAATMQAAYDKMEKQVTVQSTGSSSSYHSDSAVDPTAPLLGFLSHGKDEAGSMAKLLKLQLKRFLKVCWVSENGSLEDSCPNLFLDSDDLFVLSDLLEEVVRSKTFILIMTKTSLLRPWVICEWMTAIKSGVPILPVDIMGSGFDLTASNVKRRVNACVDSAVLTMVREHFPDASTASIAETLKQILEMPRVHIDPKETNPGEGAFELANALIAKADMGSDHKLEAVTSDPIHTPLPGAQLHGEVGYISYHHSTETALIARIVRHLIDDQLRTRASTFFWVDGGSLPDVKSRMNKIEGAGIMMVLLTNETLRNPSVIIEMVQASRNGVSLLPVVIDKCFDFRTYTSDAYYRDLPQKFDRKAHRAFKAQGIRFPEICRVIRVLFDVIAMPFNSHSSEAVQKAQVYEITRRLARRTRHSRLPA